MGRRTDESRYSNRAPLLVFCAMAIVGGLSCKCSETGKPATTPPVDAQLQEDLSRLPQGGGNLVELLATEKASRPTTTPTLEGVMDGATKAGVSFGPLRQLFGRKLRALYCAGVDSLDGLIITVCEYPNPEQAKRGEADAKLMGTSQQSRVRGKSVLHVVARSDSPPESLAKVIAAFEAQ
jgi:hypothetical protein